jgi:hypothetical protein
MDESDSHVLISSHFSDFGKRRIPATKNDCGFPAVVFRFQPSLQPWHWHSISMPPQPQAEASGWTGAPQALHLQSTHSPPHCSHLQSIISASFLD